MQSSARVRERVLGDASMRIVDVVYGNTGGQLDLNRLTLVCRSAEEAQQEAQVLLERLRGYLSTQVGFTTLPPSDQAHFIQLCLTRLPKSCRIEMDRNFFESVFGRSLEGPVRYTRFVLSNSVEFSEMPELPSTLNH